MTATAIEPEEEEQQRALELEALVGKRVLVGITELDPEGVVVRQYQLTGLIVAASPGTGVDIEQDENGGWFNLPPEPSAFHPANPGHYRLKATGRIIIDPDLISTWDFHERASN